MVKVNYHLAERQIEALKELSKREGLSVAELIRRAIDAWLENGKHTRERKP
jgi:predicted DNA-binding protein